jgi:DNA-binding protein HU-beta
MNKSNLTDIVAADTGLARARASEIVDTMLQAIQQSLARGEDVKFQGFGIFKAIRRPARTHRDPNTGGTIDKAADVTIRFKPGELLKAAVQ